MVDNKREKDPCMTCDCYDPDMGCTMSSLHKGYACSLESDEEELERFFTKDITEFFMAMKPPTVTHQEKKVKIIYKDGKPVPQYYEPAELEAARSKLSAHLAKHIPAEPYTGAVRCIVKWLFPITNDKHKDGDWKETKPDTHNMNKLLFDVMEDLGFWKNDALVASEIIEKFWAKTPGIYIRIEKL